MPIYEYACASCGSRFEQRQAVGAERPPCPSCDAVETKRLLSMFSTAGGPSASAAPIGPLPTTGGGGCCGGGGCACGH